MKNLFKIVVVLAFVVGFSAVCFAACITESAKKYYPQNKDELVELARDLAINLGDIDTSAITDMSELFKDSKRNDYSGIELWDTSSVTNMEEMFRGAEFFNQPLNSWNVSKVENMRNMFRGAKAFNHPINSWNVANVENIQMMFYKAKSFNQPLDKWNVSNIEDMYFMFSGAESFNQPLDKWNVSKVKNMEAMFSRAKSFNQNLDSKAVFGLIAYLKEQKNCKIVMIFDKTKISKSEIDIYKDKIIDRDFLFAPEVDDMFEIALGENGLDDKYKEIAKEYFKSCNLNNIRVMKRVLNALIDYLAVVDKDNADKYIKYILSLSAINATTTSIDLDKFINYCAKKRTDELVQDVVFGEKDKKRFDKLRELYLQDEFQIAFMKCAA